MKILATCPTTTYNELQGGSCVGWVAGGRKGAWTEAVLGRGGYGWAKANFGVAIAPSNPPLVLPLLAKPA